MPQLTEADMIWNRACGDDPLRSLPGDRALVDLLRAHGLAMNGGVLHAIECLTALELSGAEAGFRFYGFDAVASLLSRARKILASDNNLDAQEAQLDRQYADMVPSDSTLFDRFKEHFQSNPSEYAPRRAVDMA